MLKRVILIYFVLSGCESREILPKTTGVEYFPVRVDTYWEYDVVETTISEVEGQTNSFYELRILISDSITVSGETTYILERSVRPEPTEPWTAIETWSARKNSFQAIQQEGNLPFIKLSFPLSEGKTWNGNALNNLGGTESCGNGTFTCDNYEIKDLDKPFESTGVSYDNSVTVFENNVTDPIVMQDVRKSVYVRSIGLVYRESSLLSYCTVGSCIGQQIVENGFIFRQTLKAHGTI